MKTEEKQKNNNYWDIDPESEQKVWQRYNSAENKDDVISDVVECYLPVVNQVVKKMAFRIYNRVEPRELIGVAVIGLYEAVQRYSEDKNDSFIRFALPRIKGAILDELRKRDPLTRRQRFAVKKVYQAISELSMQNGKTPSIVEISRYCEIPPDEVESYMGLGSATVNLEDEFEGGLKYMDVLPDDSGKTPETEMDRKIILQILRDSIRKLGERDQQILFFRHHEGLSVKEVAEIMNISIGRVSQLYNAAIVRLRALMNVV